MPNKRKIEQRQNKSVSFQFKDVSHNVNLYLQYEYSLSFLTDTRSIHQSLYLLTHNILHIGMSRV